VTDCRVRCICMFPFLRGPLVTPVLFLGGEGHHRVEVLWGVLECIASNVAGWEASGHVYVMIVLLIRYYNSVLCTRRRLNESNDNSRSDVLLGCA
jgi:hypothetical protein